MQLTMQGIEYNENCHMTLRIALAPVFWHLWLPTYEQTKKSLIRNLNAFYFFLQTPFIFN